MNVEIIEKIHQHIKIIKQHRQTADMYVARMEQAFEKINHKIPLTIDIFYSLTIEEIGLFDAISMRFTKLQDLIGGRIFPLILEIIEEDTPKQTYLDRLNKLEQLHFLDNAYTWRTWRDLRNDLTHNYATNDATKLVDDINAIMQASRDLLEYWKSLREKIIELEKKDALIP